MNLSAGPRGRALIDHQNLVRGVFARRSSRAFVKKIVNSETLVFRTGLRSSLLSARAALHDDEYEVLADGQVVLEIRKQHRELCGIEMEVYGLYAAAHNASEPRPVAFALKSVCDFADADKKDEYQKYSAYTSARVMCLLFERYGRRLLDSR